MYLEDGPAHQLSQLEPERLEAPALGEGEYPAGADRPQDYRRLRYYAAKAYLALAQRLLGQLALENLSGQIVDS